MNEEYHGNPVKMTGISAVPPVLHTRSVHNKLDIVTAAPHTITVEWRWFSILLHWQTVRWKQNAKT
jgi:hypothetical protein